MQLTVTEERWPIRGRFAISRESRTEARVVVATLTAEGRTGRGECVPYPRYGESVEGVMADIEAMAPRLAEGLDRQTLRAVMPAGAARNAIDCRSTMGEICGPCTTSRLRQMKRGSDRIRRSTVASSTMASSSASCISGVAARPLSDRTAFSKSARYRPGGGTAIPSGDKADRLLSNDCTSASSSVHGAPM